MINLDLLQIATPDWSDQIYSMYSLSREIKKVFENKIITITGGTGSFGNAVQKIFIKCYQ